MVDSASTRMAKKTIPEKGVVMSREPIKFWWAANITYLWNG